MAREALVRDAAASPEQQWGALAAGDVPDLSAAYAKLTDGKVAHEALPALVSGDIPDLGATYAKLTGGKIAHGALPALIAGDIPDLSASYAALTGGKISHGALPALVAGDIPDLSASYAALVGGKVAAAAMPTQAAIADLNLGTLALLPDTITAIGTLAARVNTLLAELRTAGLIAP